MEISQLFKDVNALVGTDAFRLDDDACRIQVGDLVVDFLYLPSEGALATSAAVGKEPEDGRDQFYQLAMQSMYMFRNTAGSSLSLDADTRDICLQRRDDLRLLDAEAFRDMLETFVGTARAWRHTLQEFLPLMLKESRGEGGDAAARIAEESRQFRLGGEFLRV